MSFARARDRIIRAISGSRLFEGVNSRDLAAAFAGDVKAASAPIDGIAPWSARINTDGSSRVLKILAVLLLVFFAWAVLFQIDKVTRGAGRVLPSVQNQVVQHLEGGIVEQLLVREGQRVRKGDVLMRISNQFTSADFNNARTDVAAKKIALARMDAEVSGARAFSVPKELADVAPDIASSEEALFYSRINQFGQESGIMNEQARARRSQIGSLQSRLVNLRSEERLMMTQLDKLERAFEAEAISEREVLDKRAALLALRTKIADVQNDIPTSMAQLGEVSARRGEIWTRMVNETKEKAAELRLELSKADQSYDAYSDKQSREEIRAPMDGIVNKLYIQTVGGVIRRCIMLYFSRETVPAS